MSITSMLPLPRFYFFDKDMFYSTPNETKVFMICQPPPGQLAQPDTTLRLTGYGQFELFPSCTLTMPDGTTHHTPNRPVNASLYDQALFKEITQWSMPTREKVIIDNSPMFSYITKATQTITNPEPVGTFTDRMIKNFDAAAVTANTGSTIAIILSMVAVAFLFYFCYYKRLCNHCCKGKTKTSTLNKVPPPFCEPVDVHWFKEDGTEDLDKLTTRAPPSRQASFRSPLSSLNTSFPKWVMNQSAPHQSPLKTSTQMAREIDALNSYQDDLAHTHLAGLQGHESGSLPNNSRIYRPSDSEIEQQQRLLERQQHEAAIRQSQAEARVHFDASADAINIIGPHGATHY
jgi:hypothetical protein